MTSYGRQRLDRGRLGTLEHSRQVTDHPTGSVSQSQLDRMVQILDDITEPAGNLKDQYLPEGALPELHLRSCGLKEG